MEKPILFNSRLIPLDQLNDEKFADFIYSIIPFMFPDFQLIGSPPKTWDGGFDARAKHKNNGKYICIQSKRYDSKLTLSQIGTELAKVALTSKDEKFITSRHYFFSIAGATKEVYFLEKPDRKKLKCEALKAVKKAKNFKTVKAKLKKKE